MNNNIKEPTTNPFKPSVPPSGNPTAAIPTEEIKQGVEESLKSFEDEKRTVVSLLNKFRVTIDQITVEISRGYRYIEDSNLKMTEDKKRLDWLLNSNTTKDEIIKDLENEIASVKKTNGTRK